MRRCLPRFLSESQMVALAKAPNVNTPEGPRDRAVLSVLLSTGVRASELCALRVRDVTSRLVFVRDGKGGVQRYVPISQAAWARVCLYLERYPARSDEPLFRTGPRRPLTRRRLHKIVTRYSQVLGLPSGVHVTRHSFATRAINRGVSLRSVQVMLGHVRLSTTAIYLGVALSGLVAEYKRCLEVAPQRG